MRAGWKEIDITPPLGTALGGDPRRDHGFEKVLEPVMAQTLVLEDDGGRHLVFITADVTGTRWSYTQRLAAALARRFHLSNECVAFNCSHTHSGPGVNLDIENDPPRDIYDAHTGLHTYIPWLLDALADAIGDSLASLKRTRLFFGKGRSSIGVNRRRIIDGRCHFMPNPEGYYDRDLHVIAVGDCGARPHALLFVHGCHVNARYGGDFRFVLSPDFPGVARAALKEELGQEVVPMFGQGAGGDIRPPCVGPDGIFCAGTTQDVDRMGKQLAKDVSAVLEGGMAEIADARFSAALGFATLPLDPVPPPAEFERLSKDESVAEPHRRWAERISECLTRGQCIAAYMPLPMQVMRLSPDHLVITLGHEVVSEIGGMIKEVLAPQQVAVMGYTNDVDLYIPVTRMFSEGGEEAAGHVWRLYPTRQAPGVEGRVVAKAVELARASEIAARRGNEEKSTR